MTATLTDNQIAQLADRLPKNTTYPFQVLKDLRAEGKSSEVYFYFRAREIARVQFLSYQTLLKKPYAEVAVANSVRYYLKDYIRLWEFLTKREIPVTLYVLAQTERLKKVWQVRGMRSERSLCRYFDWLEEENQKVYFPSEALANVEAKVARLDADPVTELLTQWEEGKAFVALVQRRSGLSLESVLYLEAWHLPAGYLAGCPEALALAEDQELDLAAVTKIKEAAKTLQRFNAFDRYITAVHKPGAEGAAVV